MTSKPRKSRPPKKSHFWPCSSVVLFRHYDKHHVWKTLWPSWLTTSVLLCPEGQPGWQKEGRTQERSGSSTNNFSVKALLSTPTLSWMWFLDVMCFSPTPHTAPHLHWELSHSTSSRSNTGEAEDLLSSVNSNSNLHTWTLPGLDPLWHHHLSWLPDVFLRLSLVDCRNETSRGDDCLFWLTCCM